MMIAEHRGSIACLGMVVVIAAGCARPAQGPTKAPEGAPGVATPAAQDVADAESDAHSLQSKVTRVTVYSDRARVTRQATAQVPGEPTVFAFRSLPGWTSADPSLCPHDVSRRHPCLLCATDDAPVTQELPVVTLKEPE